MKWGVLFGWLLWVVIAQGAESEPNSLPYLRAHPEDWPRQVILKEETSFKIILNGKESGTMTLPAATAAVLVGIGDSTLQVSNGANTATVPAEQTDLWNRVQEIRTKRNAPGYEDPAVKVVLPLNSETAEWYKKQIDEQLTPWLAKYPKHPLAAEMTARKDAFEKEAVRIVAGEVRRSENWYSAAEFAARRNEFAAEDLLLKLNQFVTAPNLEQLKTELPEIEKFAKTAVHPQLLRAAVAAINASATPNDPAAELREKYSLTQADNEDKALARLKEAESLPPKEALPVLIEVEKLWPGLELIPRVTVAKTEDALDTTQKALDTADITAAMATRVVAEKLLALLPGNFPDLAALRKKLESSAAPLALARDLQKAFDTHDYQKVLTTEISNATPGLKKWAAGLQGKIKAQQEASSQAIAQAQSELLHFQITTARDTYEKARELWPDNPELASRDRILKIATYVGGLIALFIVLGIWGYLSKVRDDLRYKSAMKKKMKELNQRPKM